MNTKEKISLKEFLNEKGIAHFKEYVNSKRDDLKNEDLLKQDVKPCTCNAQNPDCIFCRIDYRTQKCMCYYY